MITYSAETPESRATMRAAVTAGALSRSPVNATIIAAQLDITEHDLRNIDGIAGDVIVPELFRQLGVEPDPETGYPRLGEAAEALGLLTEEEAAWLDN